MRSFFACDDECLWFVLMLDMRPCFVLHLIALFLCVYSCEVGLIIPVMVTGALLITQWGVRQQNNVLYCL
jgi:hypothetical protein